MNRYRDEGASLEEATDYGKRAEERLRAGAEPANKGHGAGPSSEDERRAWSADSKKTLALFLHPAHHVQSSPLILQQSHLVHRSRAVSSSDSIISKTWELSRRNPVLMVWWTFFNSNFWRCHFRIQFAKILLGINSSTLRSFMLRSSLDHRDKPRIFTGDLAIVDKDRVTAHKPVLNQADGADERELSPYMPIDVTGLHLSPLCYPAWSYRQCSFVWRVVNDHTRAGLNAGILCEAV
ncbi:hypothetical protein VNI00_006059 [Paramarasmius palmivorus]|uniref:Uncharacterized protein n=1 Tax=Paramarasmius palmivorus TaxID=297713 RepID=A0AAW0DB41_9AGAR